MREFFAKPSQIECPLGSPQMAWETLALNIIKTKILGGEWSTEYVNKNCRTYYGTTLRTLALENADVFNPELILNADEYREFKQFLTESSIANGLTEDDLISLWLENAPDECLEQDLAKLGFEAFDVVSDNVPVYGVILHKIQKGESKHLLNQ